MNRHQSNPFLAGWEEANTEPVATNLPDAHDLSGGQQQQQTRRHSNVDSSNSANSFSTQRSVDMRLYRRNMSSFEAASLQLEQQQKMLDNDAKSADVISAHKDLIAKMTADFQNAIESNDRQFQDPDGNQLDFNPFDPFETIVDDDVSIPSPLTQANNQDKFKLDNNERSNPDGAAYEEGRTNEPTDRPDSIKFDQGGASDQADMKKHDSIDDDEAELVSTPVRNIKSSQMPHRQGETLTQQESNGIGDHDNQAQSGDDLNNGDNNQRQQQQQQDSGSMTKASLFASLLASAESSGQQVPIDISADEDAPIDASNGFNKNPVNHESNLESATRVIKGSPSAADGNIDRPVSFFDPFETVIDKDALTSLVNDNQSTSTTEKDRSPEGVVNQEVAYGKQDRMDADSNDINGSNMHMQRPSRHVAESTSVETVIENSNSSSTQQTRVKSFQNETQVSQGSSTSRQDELRQQQQQQTNPGEDDFQNQGTHMEPEHQQTEPEQEIYPPISRPHPTPNHSQPLRPSRKSQRPARRQQDDMSSDSSDDDRIQIVIRARDAVGDKDDPTKSKTPIIVPLLPPPPSKSSMKQARERGQVEDMPSPVMSYKSRQKARKSQHPTGSGRTSDFSDDSDEDDDKPDEKGEPVEAQAKSSTDPTTTTATTTAISGKAPASDDETATESADEGGQFVIPMTHSDDDSDNYGKPDTPLYDDDTSYVLEEFPPKYEGPGWDMMLRYPPKKKLTSNRFWKRIFVKLAQVPVVPPAGKQQQDSKDAQPQLCWALQIYDKMGDKKPMQEIPIQATYTVSEISSQLFDQYGKIFTIKLQYIFYKERVGVRQGQLARFIHSGHVGTSTTSGGHGVDPISIGAIKRIGAPIEHSPQISQIIKLGCTSYEDIKQFKNCLEDCLFKMPIHRDRALTTYKTEEVQMAVRDEAYLELNQIGTITKQLARVRLFFLSFLNGTPIVEIGINDIHRQGREVVGRMDILPVVTEEWIRLEACELHSTVDKAEFESVESRIIKLTPPDATFFELMRFRVRPPRNRELPLQISANMSVSRTKVSINCEVMVPGEVSRKHGQIPCENIAIRIHIPECWIYFFREEKHFRMGSKKSVNRRPGKVKGIERFLGGGALQDFNDDSSLIEVTSGQAKYEHHHNAIVWRATRWPKENRASYVQNTMKIRLPLSAYDKMPENFYEYVHVEYTMPATTVSHTTLRSISVNPCDDEPPEKYVKYSAKFDYKVKMRLSVNLGSQTIGNSQAGKAVVNAEPSPIVIMKQPDLDGDLQREEDSFDDDDSQGDHENPED